MTESHTVTPDNRVDILFDSDGKVFFSGPMSKYFKATNRRVFGIRFRPEYVYSIFKIPLSELTDQATDLDEIYGEASLLSDLKESCGGFGEFVSKFNRHFLNNDKLVSADRRVSFLTKSLEAGLLLNDVKSKLGITEQHLRRLSLQHLGISPKQFERIERFKRAKATRKEKAIDLSQLALDCGYFDQSHLTNEFKELSGSTPSKFFS